MRTTIAVLLFSALAFNAQARTITADVLRVNTETKKVVVGVENTRGIEKGDFLSMGRNCELEVVNKTSSRIIVDAGLCETSSTLRRGKTVSLSSDMPVIEEEAAQRSISSGFDDMSTSSAAQYSTRSSRSRYIPDVREPGTIAEGMRLSFAVPNLDAEIEVTDNIFGASESIDQDAEGKYQLGLGYSNIRQGRPGFIGIASVTRFEPDGEDVQAFRIEASMSYGFDERVYVFGGLNLNKFTDGPAWIEDADVGPGWQIGAGFQANQNLGFEIKNVRTNNLYDFEGGTVEAETVLTGIEFGAVATF